MNDVCSYHHELVNAVKDLKETADRTDKTVTEIRSALVGTLNEQGLIGKFYAADEKQRSAIDELIEWRSKVNGVLGKLAFKLIGLAAGAVATGSVAAFLIVKFMVG
jgi:hypothetical protein